MQDVKDIIFCTRSRYDDPHWYANIGYFCDDENKKAYAGNGAPDDGKLCRWNVRTNEVQVLLDAQGGSIRDPQVHYDGQKILFSYRPARTDVYHLYEINCDGTGLRQLTFGDYDDYEPIYLPDGDIAFVSTRCQRWVNCWMTQVGVIYRCKGDGSDVRLISANTEHDNTPWVLPDGRLLYMRWEYVDRSQVEYHGLWTMDPDGAGQMVYFGNMHSHIVMIDAKPIPGTDQIVASFSPGHGINEHAGIATVVSPKCGPDEKSFARPLHGGKWTRDPYPVAADCFLAARDNELVLMDGTGAIEPIYRYPGPGQLHEPRPLQARPRERIIASRARPDQPSGRMFLADVHRGRHLDGVSRGQIKKLLILESLPKQVNFSGGPDLVSWLGTFTLERVLGTVPVEADGSAFFEVPADRQVFFVALDENDLSVKRMQSWCSVRPGETISCVGCHEQRTIAPDNKGPQQFLAMERPPSRIQSFAGYPDVLDFTRDVQPILDRHCVSCHTYEKRDGQVILAGDLGPHWSHSFFSLFAHRQVADGRNGLGNQPPRTIGSSASPLLKKFDGSHYDAKCSPQEWRTLWLWIESGATYVGSYAALRNEREQQLAGQAVLPVFGEQHALLQRRCRTCHESDADGAAKPLPLTQEWGRKIAAQRKVPTGSYERVIMEHDPIARFSPNILVNFTTPERSPLLLGPLAKAAGGYESCGAVFTDRNDPDYQLLLRAIEKGKAAWDASPRYATAGFKPNRQYIREMQRYGILPASFDASQDAVDVFAVDQKYWASFWYRPQ
jgi:cytochrome c2